MTLIELVAQPIASSSTEPIFSRSWSGPEVTTRASASPAAGRPGPGTRLALDILAGREGPVLGEGVHELRDDRALEAEMGVGHRIRRPFRHEVPAEMFMPPVNPTVPSTTSSFLWLRRLRKGMRHGMAECMNSATGMPGAAGAGGSAEK